MRSQDVQLAPIAASEVAQVAEFLHRELNARVSTSAWTRVMSPPWTNASPDCGFMLVSNGRVVGAYLTVKSQRDFGAEPVEVCNLGAFCVLDDYRPHSIRLLRAVLAQKGFTFTDFSPSGNVVGLNERLGFSHFDTSTRLVVNRPAVPRRHIVLSSDPQRLDAVLGESDRKIFHDHRSAPAARHLLVETPGGHAYLVFRRDRRKHLPWFASPLYVGGDGAVLARAWPAVGSYLLGRHGLPFTLAERRILGFSPGRGFDLKKPRAKMFRGGPLSPESMDYLYSELTLVEW